MSKQFATLFSLKNVTQSMKMNVKLFTRRDAPLNMNWSAPQVTVSPHHHTVSMLGHRICGDLPAYLRGKRVTCHLQPGGRWRV